MKTVRRKRTAQAAGPATAKKKRAQTRSRPSRSQNKDELQFVYDSAFRSPRAEKNLWGPQAPDIKVPQYQLIPRIADSKTSTRQSARNLLSREEERVLFLRYNYAKYKLSQIKDQSSKAAQKWRQRADQARFKIVHANLPLVPAMASRRRAPNLEFHEMVSEGYMAVLRSVEHFDVSRGFKFSTYACRAILSSFSRAGKRAGTYRKHIPVNFDPEMERSDYDERRHDQERISATDVVREVLAKNQADLDGTERAVITKRFPLGEDVKRMTLAQLGDELSMSSERVRQIEKRSLAKLKLVVEEALPI